MPSALGWGIAIGGGAVGRGRADVDALFIAAALDGVVATHHVVHSGFGAMSGCRIAAASPSVGALQAVGPAILEVGWRGNRSGGCSR